MSYPDYRAFDIKPAQSWDLRLLARAGAVQGCRTFRTGAMFSVTRNDALPDVLTANSPPSKNSIDTSVPQELVSWFCYLHELVRHEASQ